MSQYRKGNFIYVIYDIEDFTIWGVFRTEEECISIFKEFYEGFKNIDWKAFNLSFVLKDYFSSLKSLFESEEI